MNVLLTGFESFDKDPLNPSWEVARALDGWQPAVKDGACTVRAVQLPCVFGDAIARLEQAVAQWQPTLVICLGLAGGRTEITPERVAINVDDARIPDNAGRQPVDTAVHAGGPAAYFSTLPIKAMVEQSLIAGERTPLHIEPLAQHVGFCRVLRCLNEAQWVAGRNAKAFCAEGERT